MAGKMAGGTRSELASNSPEGPSFTAAHPNGPRGSYSSASMERSGSFRESLDNRGLSSAAGNTRSTVPLPLLEIPLASQSLMLEPLNLGDQKYTRSGELRRVFGVSVEDHSFGAVQSKPLSLAASEELKRFKASLLDSATRARERMKVLHDSMVKLDRYRNQLLKKRQKNEISFGEKSGGVNFLKIGSQTNQNPSDLAAQRLEDRTKNIVPNKRMRSAVVEVRSEGRGIVPLRQGLVLDKDKNIAMDKDKNILRACNGGSVPVEDKTRGLPTGGDGWEKKMKRKRSVGSGTVITRTIDGDREFKQAMQQRLSNESRPRSCDGLGLRPGSSSGITGTNKNESSSQLNGATARNIPRDDLDNVSVQNDRRERSSGLDKERSMAKGANKLNIHEEPQLGSPLTKGKASRAPRPCPSAAMNTSSNFSRTSGVLDGWDQTQCLNKAQSLGGANNRKRPLPTGSSSPPVAQWVGQRPQKISRTRRTNLVSPVSHHDETQVLAEGFSAADIGARLMSTEAGEPLNSRSLNNNVQQLKLKLENVQSPAGLSESDESGVVENKSKEKGIDNGEVDDGIVNGVQRIATLVLPAKKNRMSSKEDIGDGVRRQGRSGRVSAQLKASMSLTKEKLENLDMAKPPRSGRPGSDTSKLGRPPSKKGSERKALTRPGHVMSCGSSEQIAFAGELDDDCEELLMSANSARNASYHACSSAFWKKMEQVFSFGSLVNLAYLKQQINFAEELDESLCDMLDADHRVGEVVHQLPLSSATLVSGEKQDQPSLIGLNKSKDFFRSIDESEQVGGACGKLETERWLEKIIPLSERLLAAIIEEDETEMFDCGTGHANPILHSMSDYSSYGIADHVNCEEKDLDRIDSELESELDSVTQKNCSKGNPCNGFSTSSSFKSLNHKHSFTDEMLQENNLLPGTPIGVNSETGQKNPERTPTTGTNFSGSPYECEYEFRCLDDKILIELQSIGLCQDTVPGLADGEDDEVNRDLSKLKMSLYQQVRSKKGLLSKLEKDLLNVREADERKLEQVAMDKCAEMAYKKYLGGRGSHGPSNKSGLSKVSKQAALAFAKRTLARYRKFKDTGRSCFQEPTYQAVLFSASLQSGDTKSIDGVLPIAAANLHAEAHTFQHEQRKSGSGVSTNVIERHESFCHNLDGGSLDSCLGPSHVSDQAFAKQETFSNRGKKKEVLLDDVGGAASRAALTLSNTLPGGAKGKRSERDRDQNSLTRNAVAKAGRPSSTSLRGERKTKMKPKQKTAQLSTSGNGLLGRFSESASSEPLMRGSYRTVNSGCGKGNESGMLPSGAIAPNLSKEMEEAIDFTNLPLESIEELDVSGELGGQGQDIGSWLSFDEDNLLDNDLTMGLEIPMDDLSELNMNF